MTLDILVREAAKTIGEIVAMANKAARMAKRALEIPYKVVETTGEVVEIVEAGCGIIVPMDQAISEVCRALSEVSDGHSRMWRRSSR